MITSTPNKIDSFFYKKFFPVKRGGLNVNPNRQNVEGLIDTEKRYHRVLEKLNELRQSTINPICDEAERIGGKFWGVWKTKTTQDLAIFTYSKSLVSTGSYNVKWIGTDQKAKVEITPDENLPPLIEEITDQEAYQKLRERFDGKFPQIPYRQDLFDLYHIYEHKSKRYYAIRSCCMEILRNEAERIYHENKQDFFTIHTIKLSFGAREYLYLIGNSAITSGCISEPSKPVIEKRFENAEEPRKDFS